MRTSPAAAPRIALKILLEHCGHSTGRWEALAAAMTFEYDEAKPTFGEFLDSLDDAPATPRTDPPVGRPTRVELADSASETAGRPRECRHVVHLIQRC